MSDTSQRYNVFPRDADDPNKGFGVKDSDTGEWTDRHLFTENQATNEMARLNRLNQKKIEAENA